MDTAVDWCERRILSDLNIKTEGHSLTLPDVLRRIAYQEEDVKLLADFFVVENKSAGEYLFLEGDIGDSLYFVGSGTVVVVMNIPRQQERILHKYQAGAILGEMAIYTGDQRTASVRIEEDAVLFKLEKDQLSATGKSFPASTAALHTYIVRLMAERLGRANRALSRYI